MGTGNGNGSAAKKVETRKLQVELTKDELLARGDDLANCELKIEELKLEASVTAGEIRKQQKLRKELAHTIDRGSEEREVECTWVEDFPKNVFRLKRNDTGKEVDTRPMTADDRTGSLFAAGNAEDAELGAPPPRTPKKRGAKKRATTKGGDNVRQLNA